MFAPDGLDLHLADEWDILPLGLWGKRTHTLSHESDDDLVLLYVEEYPGRGVRWHTSPPVERYKDCDFARGAYREKDTGALLRALVERAKGDALENYCRWIRGEQPTSTEYEATP